MKPVALLVLLGACSGATSPSDAGSIDARVTDAGASDAQTIDTGMIEPGDAGRPPAAFTISPDRRRLLADGQPFLIKELSAWGLIQALSESDAAAAMDALQARGFNTLMISVISDDTRFAGGPPYWNGISPFEVEWDFSTPNEAYFQHVDRVLAMARDRGLLVLLVPSYLGYTGDASQGWWNEISSATNSVAKSRAYGEFLGQRYASLPNIVWVAGGDNNAEGELTDHMLAVIEGIRAHDDHLWTGHFDQSRGIHWSTERAPFAPYMSLDGMYAWTESTLASEGPQYRTELDHYSRGAMPIFQLDQSYEHDTPHAPDNEDPQWIRRKNYDGLLSGCAGTSFSPGTADNQCYTWNDWRPLMDTQGMREVEHCFRLFDSRPWQLLVPDTESTTVVSGRGTFGSIDYACAARTSDGSTVIAYLPVGQTITVDMSRVSSGLAHPWWYDPRSGATTDLGTLSTTGTHDFAPPDGQDWVLVIDDDSLGRPAPGR